ncbi:MAG: DUF72 domain-containing protein [Desulfobacterales bacterium]
MNKILVGTSGWNYDHWRGVFYPHKGSKSKWLDFYAQRFISVEVNATFYRLMNPRTFEKWYQRTPEGFVWAVKASRYITHIRRLKDVRESLKKCLQSSKPLREKLGPILFQLPPTLSFDMEVFERFCNCLEEGQRYTIEARHPSWLEEKAQSAFKRHHIAWCISDTAGRYPYLEAITSEFIYIRLHGSKKLYASEYSDDELERWAEKIRKWNIDTYVYFDNDYKGYAPKNALRLKELLYQR